ncbi:MAG: 3-alpha domain-containing protein [Paracoccaceae bacterium]|nr:3-alpha domain-containing protein [Paracoccaceae bacterium]
MAAPGDRLVLSARPNPAWPLDRVWRLLYRDPPEDAPLREFAALTGLSASWRSLALRRQGACGVEDWTLRLSG